MLDTLISACLNSSQASNEHCRPTAKAAPLFSDTPCRITTGPDSKAAMNRPQRFRGLATDPGVQRKAPRTVIQRENKPKGPRLEEQSEDSRRPTPVAGPDWTASLSSLLARAAWDDNRALEGDAMFNFTSTEEKNGKTIARLGEYTAHFTSSARNTRITAVVIADEDSGECRATGSLFYHYDAAAQGHSHCDTGARQYDNNVLV